jgi:hypothetical protein
MKRPHENDYWPDDQKYKARLEDYCTYLENKIRMHKDDCEVLMRVLRARDLKIKKENEES